MSGTWSCAGGANAQRAPGPSSTWQPGYKTWFVRQAGLWGSCLEEPQKAEMLWQGSRCGWQQAGSGRSVLERRAGLKALLCVGSVEVVVVEGLLRTPGLSTLKDKAAQGRRDASGRAAS